MSYDLYVDSYLGYKRGTKTVFKWLFTTAQLHNLGDKKQFSSTKATQSFSLAKYAEFARSIASCAAPRVKVSKELLCTLRSVIYLRKSLSFMHLQKDTTTQESTLEAEQVNSNSGHAYIILVLEEIQDCLENLEVVEEKTNLGLLSSDEKVIDKQVNESTENLFDALDVEDTKEPVVSQELIKYKGKGKHKARVKTDIKAITFSCDEEQSGVSSTEELYFLIFCFFKDADDVRKYLRVLWAQYREGKLPLETASVTTDLAFEVVRHKESELMNHALVFDGKSTTVELAIPFLESFQNVSAICLYWTTTDEVNDCIKSFKNRYLGDLLFGFISGTSKGSSSPSQDTADAFLKQHSIASSLCIPEFFEINLVQGISSNTQKPEGSSLSKISNLQANSGSNFREQFQRDSEKLKNFFKHFVKLAQLAPDDQPMDIWSKAMTEMACQHLQKSQKKRKIPEYKPIPVWLVWATSVVMDIGRASNNAQLPQNSIGRAFQELRSFAVETKSIIQQHFKWSKEWPNSDWPSSCDDKLEKHIDQIEEWIINEKGAQNREKSGGHLNWLLMHNPIWCGIFLTSYRLSLWASGIALANAFQSTFLAIHLHNFTVMESDIKFEWQDLDYLVDLHGEDWLFLGSRPAKHPDYLSRLSMAYGQSAKVWAATWTIRSKNRIRDHDNAYRMLRPSSIKLHMLAERYHALSFVKKPNASLSCLGTLLSWQKDQSASSTPNSNNPQESGLVTLLQVAATCITEGHRHLLFNYFDMHLKCWDMLLALQRDLYPFLRNCDKEFMERNEEALRHVPIWIIKTTDIVPERGDKYLPSKPRVLDPVISVVYRSMRSFVDDHGSKGMKKVKELLERNGKIEDVNQLPVIEAGSESKSKAEENQPLSANEGETRATQAEASNGKKKSNKNKNRNRRLRKEAEREQTKHQVKGTELSTTASTLDPVSNSEPT